MKYLLLIILLSVPAACFCQNKMLTVSLNGIGDIKTGMKKETVERLLKQKFAPGQHRIDWSVDTLFCQYKHVGYMLVFKKNYEETPPGVYLKEVNCSAPQLKTRSGIGVGTDKHKIINTYADYRMEIIPMYDSEARVQSKTKSTVWVYDSDTDKVIVFHLYRNKVESISAALYQNLD